MEPVTIFFILTTLYNLMPSDDCRVQVAPPVQAQHLSITGEANKIIAYDTYVDCDDFNKALNDKMLEGGK